MGLRGDFSELAALRRKLAAAPQLREQLLKVAAAAALTEVQLGFRGGVDPYGEPWAPLKRRKGQPLRDTGRLGNSFTARPTATGFIVGTNVAYAPFHQYGAAARRASQRSGARARRRSSVAGGGGRGIPARRMVADPGNAGPVWTRAIEDAVRDAFQKFWRR